MKLRPSTALLFLVTATLALSSGLLAAELLVFEDKACGPCILFDRQVGHIYAKTDEARRVPLRRVTLGKRVDASISLDKEVKVAPTFVLIEKGREVGRFEGYTQDELFWMNFNYLLNQLAAN